MYFNRILGINSWCLGNQKTNLDNYSEKLLVLNEDSDCLVEGFVFLIALTWLIQLTQTDCKLELLRVLTSGFSEDLQCLGVHLPSASRLRTQGFPLHQAQVGSKLYEQAHKGHLAAVTQDSIHDTARGAPVEALRVDRTVAVEVGVRPSLEEQLEALEVVVGRADVQGADHQGGEAPGERGPDVGSQVVVDIDVSPVPTGETQGQSDLAAD